MPNLNTPEMRKIREEHRLEALRLFGEGAQIMDAGKGQGFPTETFLCRHAEIQSLFAAAQVHATLSLGGAS